MLMVLLVVMLLHLYTYYEHVSHSSRLAVTGLSGPDQPNRPPLTARGCCNRVKRLNGVVTSQTQLVCPMPETQL